MRPALPSARFLIVGLAVGMLFAMVGSGVHTVAAQQPTPDSDRSMPSFEQAAATAASDSQLVALATQLLVARDNHEISFAEYREGVLFFRENHPAFYGNFFGDPLYASYDVDYFKTARLRSLAALEVHPFVGLGTMVACDPLSYDPAVRPGGQCRGFSFAPSDFFLPPPGAGPTFTTAAAGATDWSRAADWYRAGPASETERRQALVGDGSESIDQPVDIELTPVPVAIDRTITVDAPEEIETLSFDDVVKLTSHLRKRLSPRERIILATHLSHSYDLSGRTSQGASPSARRTSSVSLHEVLSRLRHASVDAWSPKNIPQSARSQIDPQWNQERGQARGPSSTSGYDSSSRTQQTSDSGGRARTPTRQGSERTSGGRRN